MSSSISNQFLDRPLSHIFSPRSPGKPPLRAGNGIEWPLLRPSRTPGRSRSIKRDRRKTSQIYTHASEAGARTGSPRSRPAEPSIGLLVRGPSVAEARGRAGSRERVGQYWFIEASVTAVRV